MKFANWLKKNKVWVLTACAATLTVFFICLSLKHKVAPVKGKKTILKTKNAITDSRAFENNLEKLATSLGVTKTALDKFFRIMRQNQVPPEYLDITLRRVSGEYRELKKNLLNSRSDDPAINTLKARAAQAMDSGDFQKCETLLVKAAEKEKNAAANGSDNSFVLAAASFAEIGCLKKIELNHLGAAWYFEKAVQILPTSSKEMLAAYLNQQGMALFYAGNLEKAIDPLKQSLEVMEKLSGPVDPSVSVILDNLARLYIVMGKSEQAKPLFLKILKIKEKNLGTQHPDVAVTLINLVELYFVEEKYEKAAPLCRRALKILEKSLGPDDPGVKKVQKTLTAINKKII